MGLNFVADLPEDAVSPRSGHTDTADALKAHPTTTEWADISPEGGYSKRATATAQAKAINDHTHEAYRDYGFQARVRSVKDEDGTEQHRLYARYNPEADKAGELAPEVPKRKRASKKAAADASEATSAPESGADTATGTDAPAVATSAVTLPAVGEAVAAPATRARAKAASSK